MLQNIPTGKGETTVGEIDNGTKSSDLLCVMDCIIFFWRSEGPAAAAAAAAGLACWPVTFNH
jgi:hypothetical protein